MHLNVVNARVQDVVSRPIYGVGERSGIRIHAVAPRISWLLFKGFWWRLREKYVIRDFHPLVLFYGLGSLMTAVGLVLGAIVTVSRTSVTSTLVPAAPPRRRSAPKPRASCPPCTTR